MILQRMPKSKSRGNIIKGVVTITAKKNWNGRKSEKINRMLLVTWLSNYVAHLNLQQVGITRETISANSFVVFVPKQTLHATINKVDINHVSNLTAKWKTMAAKLSYSELLSRLSSGYIVSNELYCHRSTIRNCYVQFCNG